MGIRDTITTVGTPMVLLVLFVLFVGCNHSIRLASSSRMMPVDQIEGWTLFSTTRPLHRMNETRRNMGERLLKVANICPSSGYDVCRTGVEGIRVALGMH